MCNAGLFIGRDHVTTPVEPTDGLTLEVANIRSGRYVYMEDLRELEKCTDDGDPIVWPTCPSPVHVAGWGEYIWAHPNKTLVHTSTGVSPLVSALVLTGGGSR